MNETIQKILNELQALEQKLNVITGSIKEKKTDTIDEKFNYIPKSIDEIRKEIKYLKDNINKLSLKELIDRKSDIIYDIEYYIKNGELETLINSQLSRINEELLRIDYSSAYENIKEEIYTIIFEYNKTKEKFSKQKISINTITTEENIAYAILKCMIEGVKNKKNIDKELELSSQYRNSIILAIQKELDTLPNSKELLDYTNKMKEILLNNSDNKLSDEEFNTLIKDFLKLYNSNYQQENTKQANIKEQEETSQQESIQQKRTILDKITSLFKEKKEMTPDEIRFENYRKERMTYYGIKHLKKNQIAIVTGDNKIIKCDASDFPYYLNKNVIILGDGIKKFTLESNSLKYPPYEIIFNNGLEEISKSASARMRTKEIKLPPSLKKIDTETFAYNNYLEEVEFYGEMEEIPEGLFKECSKLKEIKLPKGLKRIGNKSFRECNNLKKLVLPEGLENIGDYAFYKTGIEKIVLPSTTKSIGDSAFSYTPLEEIVLNDGLETIENFAFASTHLKSVNLPKSIEKCGDYIFHHCNISEVAYCGKVIPDIFYSSNNPDYSIKKYIEKEKQSDEKFTILPSQNGPDNVITITNSDKKR